VYRYSNGVPRLINLLCDTALVYGYAEQRERIDSALVTDVAREKQQGGIFPTFHPAGPRRINGTKAEAAPQPPRITRLLEPDVTKKDSPSAGCQPRNFAVTKRLLESYGIDVVSAGPLDEQFLGGLELTEHDVLLIDQDVDIPTPSPNPAERLRHWPRPVLFNDSMATRLSLRQGNPEFGRLLMEQISACPPGIFREATSMWACVAGCAPHITASDYGDD
jgi:hypothetical protein